MPLRLAVKLIQRSRRRSWWNPELCGYARMMIPARALLMNQSADSTPADLCDPWERPHRAGIERIIDEQGLALDCAPVHESPVPRILGIVAVVTQKHIVIR